jgi:hypothetical protein
MKGQGPQTLIKYGEKKVKDRFKFKKKKSKRLCGRL